MIKIEVGYAKFDLQEIISLLVPSETTVIEAIKLSGVLNRFPEIDLTQQKVGIFSKSCELLDKVSEGDRVEIYRPLIIDPKQARRNKAQRN